MDPLSFDPPDATGETKLLNTQQIISLAQLSAGFGLWDWDMVSNRLYWSREYYQLYDLPLDVEPSHESWMASIYPDDREICERATRDAIERRGDLRIYFRRLRSDGLRWFRALGTTTCDAEGNPVRMTGITLDATDVVEREHALRRANEELHRFAFVASHDLREPLRTIASYATLLERKLENPDLEIRELLHVILERVGRMDRLTKGLLDYARVTTATKGPQRIDVRRIVGEVLLDLEELIRNTQAKITISNLPVVLADEQLIRVFQNLITNAIKYRGSKPADIKISAARKGNEWVFSVADKGIGFSMTSADEIFTLFHRLHSQEDYEGAGIGLATCKRIVERNGGRIWAESISGDGATFYFTLRCAESEHGS